MLAGRRTYLAAILLALAALNHFVGLLSAAEEQHLVEAALGLGLVGLRARLDGPTASASRSPDPRPAP